jgi:hypothetical protein
LVASYPVFRTIGLKGVGLYGYLDFFTPCLGEEWGKVAVLQMPVLAYKPLATVPELL